MIDLDSLISDELKMMGQYDDKYSRMYQRLLFTSPDNEKSTFEDFLKIIKPICPKIIEKIRRNLVNSWENIKELIVSDKEFDYHDVIIDMTEDCADYQLIIFRFTENSLIEPTENLDDIQIPELFDDSEDIGNPFYQFHNMPDVPNELSEESSKYLNKLKPYIPIKLRKMKAIILECWQNIQEHIHEIESHVIEDFGNELWQYIEFRHKCIQYNMFTPENEVLQVY